MADQQDDFFDSFFVNVQCAGACGAKVDLRGIKECPLYMGVFNRHVYAALKEKYPELVYCPKCLGDRR